jgi:hypothetical protein
VKTNLALVVTNGGQAAAAPTPKDGKLRDLARQISALTQEDRRALFDAALGHFCLVCGAECGDEWCSNGCFDGEDDEL